MSIYTYDFQVPYFFQVFQQQFYNFHSSTVHLDIITSFSYPTEGTTRLL